jgi:hypothetical protein
VVLCLERTLISWLLARDGYGVHSGLRGSDRPNVTPYVHERRVVLLKPGLARVSLSLEFMWS